MEGDVREMNSNSSNNSQLSTDEAKSNKFANDGSFMEMFKKKMEEDRARKNAEKTSKTELKQMPETGESGSLSSKTSSSRTIVESPKNDSDAKKSQLISKDGLGAKKYVYPLVGKRRGGPPALKTGAVKKKKVEPEFSGKKDAWSMYMDEVDKYKSQSCQEEDKTRPLVK